MHENQHETEIDHLALGLTKQPTFMGVNIRYFFANIVICTLICVDAHTWMGAPIFIVAHLIMVRLSIKDPQYLYIRAKTLIKTPPILNRWYWGEINSYEPW